MRVLHPLTPPTEVRYRSLDISELKRSGLLRSQVAPRLRFYVSIHPLAGSSVPALFYGSRTLIVITLAVSLGESDIDYAEACLDPR